MIRGRKLVPIERAVQLITQAPAELFGLRDRGVVARGLRTPTSCVFDPETVGADEVRLVDDLPGGTARLFAGSTGVHRVFVERPPDRRRRRRRPATCPAPCCGRDATPARCRCRPEPDLGDGRGTAGARPHRRPRRSPLLPETDEILAAMAAMAEGVRLEPDALHGAGRRQDGPVRLRGRRLPRAARRALHGVPHRGGAERARAWSATTPCSSSCSRTGCSSRTCCAATPRSTTCASSAPIIIVRAAAHRHDAPAQPHGRRPRAALAAVLGEPRAGARRRPSSRRRASPTRGSPAPRSRSTSSTPRCRTSSACTR